MHIEGIAKHESNSIKNQLRPALKKSLKIVRFEQVQECIYGAISRYAGRAKLVNFCSQSASFLCVTQQFPDVVAGKSIAKIPIRSSGDKQAVGYGV